MTLIGLARAVKDYRDYCKKHEGERNGNVRKTRDMMEKVLDDMVEKILYPKIDNNQLTF